MYIPSSSMQSHIFFMCIGFGFVMGFFYHFVKFIRLTFFNFKKAVFAQDILFCVIGTFLVFFFLLCCNDGEMRLYTFLGLGLGFVVYYFTFGMFVIRFLTKVSFLIKKMFNPFTRCGKNILKKIKKPQIKANNT